MVDYRGEVSTRNDIKAKIFGVNLVLLPVYYTATPSNLHVELRHNVTDEMPIR